MEKNAPERGNVDKKAKKKEMDRLNGLKDWI